MTPLCTAPFMCVLFIAAGCSLSANDATPNDATPNDATPNDMTDASAEDLHVASGDVGVHPSSDGGAPMVAVNFVHPVWESSAADQQSILAAMKSAGVTVIRCPLNEGTAADGLAFAQLATQSGISILWNITIPLPKGATGAQPLSAADPSLTGPLAISFGTLLSDLESSHILLSGFELANEINSSGFNADFTEPGTGRILTYDMLASDPEGEQVAKGYLNYVSLLQTIKTIRDQSASYESVPIIAAGLAGVDAFWANKNHLDAVAVTDSLMYLTKNGLNDYVDYFAVHLYPSFDVTSSSDPEGVSPAARLAYIQERLVSCGTLGKSCWLTEWGVPNTALPTLSCPLPSGFDDTPRISEMQELRNDFATYINAGQVQAHIYFSWNASPAAGAPLGSNSIAPCGTLLASGPTAIAPL